MTDPAPWTKNVLPELSTAVALLFDSKERGNQMQYTRIRESAALRLSQCVGDLAHVIQAKLTMGDYLWVDIGRGELHDVAIERKTIGNLVGDSGRGRQLHQSLRLPVPDKELEEGNEEDNAGQEDSEEDEQEDIKEEI